MSAIETQIARLMNHHGVKRLTPLALGRIREVSDRLGPVPNDLVEFFSLTNGLVHEWFRVLPLEDATNPKRTWDSIERANDPSTTRFLDGDRDLLERFLVFAEIGGGNCAMIDRTDMSIWYEEDDLHQTDMTLVEFLEVEFREVRDL